VDAVEDTKLGEDDEQDKDLKAWRSAFSRHNSAKESVKHEDAHGPEQSEGATEEARLHELLERLKLGRFASALQDLGVEAVSDLAYLQDSDLERLGMPLIPRRKLVEAAGGDWRSSAEARPIAAKEVEPKAPSAEAPSTDAGADMEQLLRDCKHFIEEFCAVNCLGIPARMELLALPPRAALRAMGLLGRGNAFAMQGVRRPSAAVRSRVRIASALEAEGGAAADGPPFEDWRRLLEGFAQANGFTPGCDTWESLRILERDQALNVMGFTSGRCFLLPAGAEAAQSELDARIGAAAGGDSRKPETLQRTPEVPLPRLLPARPVPQGHTAPLAAASTTPPAVPPAAVLKAAPWRTAKAKEGGDLTLLASGVHSRSHTRSRSRSRSRRRSSSSTSTSGSRSSLQRRRPPPRRPLVNRGRSGGSCSRSRSRGRPAAAPRAQSSQEPGDFAPHWRRNLDDFVQVNELDERSSRALTEMPKLQALQIMGLVGKENSFVIRGARNASAAVMHRLQRVQELSRGRGGAAESEPFAQLPRLVEDFLSVNTFDERGIEAMRTLRRDVALQVMGFTAENAFMIRGVKNPSAALIARIANAQRRPGKRRQQGGGR